MSSAHIYLLKAKRKRLTKDSELPKTWALVSTFVFAMLFYKFAAWTESDLQCADMDGTVPVTFSCTVDINVKLRAFVPTFTPQSVAVAARMLDRTQQYVQYAPYWQVRPQVDVSRNPGLWWQHAGNAAARECRLISRRQVSTLRKFVFVMRGN